MDCAMRKCWQAAPQSDAYCLMSQMPKRENATRPAHAPPPELIELMLKITTALPELSHVWTVRRRQTAYGIGDAHAPQPGPVRVRMGDQTHPLQPFEEKVATGITGKRPARAIGSVHARRKAYDQQSGSRRTPGRNRCAVVVGKLIPQRIQMS